MNIAIVDGNSLYARSYYAATTVNSEPSLVIEFTVNTVLSLLDPNSSKIGCFFDSTLFAWDRHQNESKKREAKPSDYHNTKEIVKDVLSFLFGTVHVDHPDYEADDLVATAVYSAQPRDVVYVWSGDKDLMQLHGGNCQYYSLTDKAMLQASYINRKFVNIKRPSQVAIYLAIVGDPADNIKGVTRYGPKKCKELFEAVTPDMEFEEAVNAIIAQLPKDKEEEFFASLDRTLLRTDITGIPKPATLKLVTPREVAELGIEGINDFYRQIYEAYRT